MPLISSSHDDFNEDHPPLLKEKGVGFMSENPIVNSPRYTGKTENDLIWHDEQEGGYTTVRELTRNDDLEVYLHTPRGKKKQENVDSFPGFLHTQRYWRQIYPVNVNGLSTEIIDQIAISTDYSQTKSSETSSSSELSLSADISFWGSSLSAGYSSQISTSNGIENTYAKNNQTAKEFTFPASSAVVIWQKVQVFQLAYSTGLTIHSKKMEKFLDSSFFGITMRKLVDKSDTIRFLPQPITTEAVIVQSYIDCCPISELP